MTAFSPEVHRAIVASVGAGNYVETAAAAAGVSKQAVYDWLRRGARGDARYKQFRDDVLRAMATVQEALNTTIMQAGTTDWKAHAWKLERMFPDQYGERKKVEVVARQELEHLLDRVQSHMSESAYAELVAAIERVQRMDAGEEVAALTSGDNSSAAIVDAVHSERITET